MYSEDAQQGVVGAANMAPMAGVLARMQAQHPAAAAHWTQNVTPQGAMTTHAPKEDTDMLPFDEILNGGVIDATHTELRFVAQPQRPYRGERLIAAAFTSISGLDAFAPLVVDGLPVVGVAPISSATGRFPLSAFKPEAFGVRMSWPGSGQGTRIVITVVSLLTPTGADTITVTLGAFGGAVR
jgi:hypothetical protein